MFTNIIVIGLSSWIVTNKNVASKTNVNKTADANMVLSKKRHISFSDEQIKQKRQAVIPKATLKSDSKWDKAFRDYLREKDCANTEYWCYPDNELDDILCKFWFEVRTKRSPLETPAEIAYAKEKKKDLHSELYTIASLRNLRNGLSRFLQEHAHNIDLTTDAMYKKSQIAFKDACKELKKLGKGVIHSYPEIEHSGMVYMKLNYIFSFTLILKKYDEY